jgi:hypothetical protein
MSEMSNVRSIKDLLNVWAHYFKYRPDKGYPSASSFSIERVQTSRSTETYIDAVPNEIKKLNELIELVLDTEQKKIISSEYMNRAPQKTKAGSIGICKTKYTSELAVIHRSLSEKMYGTVSA